jgi:hypothetical protein
MRASFRLPDICDFLPVDILDAIATTLRAGKQLTVDLSEIISNKAPHIQSIDRPV